jgi:hypothetical protein
MDGWMDGWVGVKAVLRIAYINQKLLEEITAKGEVGKSQL